MSIFKTGIIVGRFQHIHRGHEKLINIGLELSDKLLIFIGSANESNTIRNPFDYELRKKLITKIYSEEIKSGKIIIQGVNDITNPSDLTPLWGKHLLNEASIYLGKKPELLIYGKDKDVNKCFLQEDMENITEVYVDRKSLKVSGTHLRECILNGEFENWKECVNNKLYDEYDKISEIIFNVYKGEGK